MEHQEWGKGKQKAKTIIMEQGKGINSGKNPGDRGHRNFRGKE